MKKIFATLMILTMLNSNAWAFSFFKKEKTQKKSSYIEQFTKNKSDEAQIRDILKNLTKYSNEHDVEKIISLYDKSYRSFDGFEYDTFKKMLQETFKAYDDISYKSDVESINLYGDKAVANLIDRTKATLVSKKAQEKFKEMSDPELNSGLLEGECNYSIYLQKINNEWKIVGDNVISEVTSVKYGSAKEYPMEFLAPLTTPKDEEYCLTLKMPVEKGVKVVAALGKEEILYPSVEPEDIFRKLPKDGILERIVRANKNGYNEYAMASVGITKISAAPDLSLFEIKMTGLAFLMQRVNVYTKLNPTREDDKNKKEESENKG